MRTIKFRAKTKGNEWVYGYYVCKIDKYYTSQPDTEIQIQDYKTKRGFAHHYILTTNLKRNLTENEKVFFKEKYFTSMFEVE